MGGTDFSDPPFDRAEPNPGYIKGYLRGVRENGGQYTHAAVWAAMAFAALGDSERVWKLFTMINPVNHANSVDSIAVDKTEPYVLAADVYALAPHTGRGGWTWYTGSAGWMYQFIVESLLGLRLEADKLHVAPCVPADWNTFQVHYRYRETVYHITVLKTSVADGGPRLTVDGVEHSGPTIPLVNDRYQHSVEVSVLHASSAQQRSSSATSGNSYLMNERPGGESAYERPLGDAIIGNGALFTREDAVEAAWAMVEPVLDNHHRALPYRHHRWGPKEAGALSAADDCWHNPMPEEAE